MVGFWPGSWWLHLTLSSTAITIQNPSTEPVPLLAPDTSTLENRDHCYHCDPLFLSFFFFPLLLQLDTFFLGSQETIPSFLSSQESIYLVFFSFEVESKLLLIKICKAENSPNVEILRCRAHDSRAERQDCPWNSPILSCVHLTSLSDLGISPKEVSVLSSSLVSSTVTDCPGHILPAQ